MSLVGAQAGSRPATDRSGARALGSAAPVAKVAEAPVVESPAPAPASPPPPPSVRYAAQSSTDWREALRSAGVRDQGEPGAPVPPPVGNHEAAAAVASLTTLDDIATHINACARCGLCRTATRAVPGEGEESADFFCVGEAPGADEDREGRPFVGAAGEILRKGLDGLKLTPAEFFIANVIKHRPPGNRDPQPEEVAACQPYLARQIALVRPRVILALGRIAAQTLLRTTRGIGTLRGNVHEYEGIPVIVTYHPAATLRNAEWKRPLWDDMKLAHRLLLERRAAGTGSD